MLIFTDYRTAAQLINLKLLNDPSIFNLTGFNEHIQDLPFLRNFTYNNLRAISDGDKSSDIYFYNIIMSEYALFLEFMQIISPLYYNCDSIVCISDSEYMNTINDFIINLIRDRYEYQAVIINNPYEYFDLDLSMYSFSKEGLVNLDLDMHKVFFEMNKEAIRNKLEKGEPIDAI